MHESPRKHWQIVDRVFAEAVRHEGPARGAYLDRACADRPKVRADVEKMLWADEIAGDSFLQELAVPAVSDVAEFLNEESGEPDEAGLRLGPYRLAEPIGSGGMGVVYRAERVDAAFQRAVAIKMARRRFARAEELQRFRTEREVLAGLDHPNIARLLDGGASEDGRPYLVIELVEGMPIDRYCVERKLGVRARIELFQQVCSAIAYAHQNLLIHRDIKPDNILVTEDGVVKVLDFGIAKLLDPASLPFAAPRTRTGLRPMTPGYASPEQIRGQPATTRSDVFVLGALLFELLTGYSPVKADEALPHEIDTAICQIDGLPVGSLRRGHSDGHRALRGDLGTIVGMALRSDPARRYGSAAELSDDLTRWGEHRPVRARPDHFTYRLRTFVRRNRVLVSVVSAAFVGLAVLSIALMGQSRTLEAERDRAEQALSFMAGMFEGPDDEPRGGRPVDPRELLDRSAARIERELGEHPDMQAVLFEAIGRMYNSLGWFDEAQPRLEESLSLRRRLAADRADVATVLYHLGRALHGRGDFEDALARYEESRAIRDRVFGSEHQAVAEALSAHAATDVALGRYDRAEPVIREALGIRRNALGEDHLDVAESLSRLGDLLYLADRDAEEVLEAYREALEIREAAADVDPLLLADSYNGVAVALHHAGRGDEALSQIARAVEIKRSILSEDHPDLAALLYGQGEVARTMGHADLAETALEEAAKIAQARLGKLHPLTAHPRLSLGVLYQQQERFDEAAVQFRHAQSAYRASYSADHPRLAGLAYMHGDFHRARGDYTEARRLLDESWRIVEGYAPPDAIVRASVKLRMGRLALDTDEAETALGHFEQALTILQQRPNPVPWFIGEVEAEVGWCLALLGRSEEGQAMIRSGLEKLDAHRPEGDLRVARARGHLREIEQRAAASSSG